MPSAEGRLDFITIDSYRNSLVERSGGKDNENKRRSGGTITHPKQVMPHDKRGKGPTDNKTVEATDPPKSKRRKGKELVRCVQHEAIDEGGKIVERTTTPFTSSCHIHHRWEPRALESSWLVS